MTAVTTNAAPDGNAAAAALAAAEENVNRNAQIQECRRQITIWSDRLRALEEERSNAILCAKLRRDAVEFASQLTVEQRRNTDILLAAIESREPLPFFKYVTNDAEGVSFHSKNLHIPVQEPPFIPTDLLGRNDIVSALMKLPDFRDGVEAFIRAKHMRVPYALNSIGGRESLIALYVACPRLFEHARDDMKKDRECVLALVRNNKNGVSSDGSRYVPERFWSDKEVHLAMLNNPEFPAVEIERKWACVPALSPLRDDLDIARAGLKPDLDQPPEDSIPTYSCRVGAVFPELSERLRGDRDVVEMVLEHGHDRCCGRYSQVLQHCSDAIKSDRDLVLRFCRRSGKELHYASPLLWRDKEVVREACNNYGGALKICSPELRVSLLQDDKFVRSCIKTSRGFEIFELLPAEMQEDESIVLDMVGYGDYDDLPEYLKEDKGFLLKVLAKEPAIYAELPDSLQNDYDLLRMALMNRAIDVFGELSWCERDDFEVVFERFPQLLADEEVFISTLNQGVWNDYSHFEDSFFLTAILELVHPSFAHNVDFWAALCKQDAHCYTSAPQAMKANVKVVKAALSADDREAMRIIDEVPACYQKDHPELIIKFMENNDDDDTTKDVFDRYASEVWSDRDVAKAFAANYDDALLYLPEKYKSDEEVVLAAVSHSHHAFNTASSALKSDASFVRRAVANDYRCFVLAPAQRRDDFAMQLTAVASDSKAILYCTRAGWKSILSTNYDSPEMGFDARVDFAAKVRSRIALKESFVVDFLRGIDIPGSHIEQGPLAVLALGHETVLAIKRSIAEYAGIPLGEELLKLIEVSKNLAIEGF